MKGRKTGGRVKGARNKNNRPRPEVLAQAYVLKELPEIPEAIRDISPLEALLTVMRWALAEQDRAGILAAACAAAPYMHARLSSAVVRVTNPAHGMSDEELKAEIALLEARIKGDPETIH